MFLLLNLERIPDWGFFEKRKTGLQPVSTSAFSLQDFRGVISFG